MIIERQPEQRALDAQLERRRYRSSEALLLRPLREGDDGFNKLFCLARISRTGDQLFLDVARNTPTVALNNDARERFDPQGNIPTVPEIRKREKYPEVSLVSGGSFLWIKDRNGKHLALLRRDESAPTEAGSLTEPAGRSGEPMSQTTIAETNEELIIVVSEDVNDKTTLKLLTFYQDESTKESLIAQSIERVARMRKLLQQRGREEEARALESILSADDVIAQDVRTLEVPNSQSQEIITRIEGREIDRIHAWSYFDEPNNTLEVRQILELELPPNMQVHTMVDGEGFLRDVRLTDISELRGEKMVPALAHYYETFISNKTS